MLKNSQDLVTLIIPIYNEEGNIFRLTNELMELNDKKKLIDRVIYVINGPKDRTREIIKKMELPALFKTIDLEINHGYGYGLKKGLKEVSDGYVLISHADLQVSTKQLFIFLSSLTLNENIFAKGLRTKRKFFDIVFTKLMTVYVLLVFQIKMNDINSQPTFIHSSNLDEIDRLPNDFAIDFAIYHMAVKNKLEIVRKPVIVTNRFSGKSSWNNGLVSKFRLSVIYMVILIKYRITGAYEC